MTCFLRAHVTHQELTEIQLSETLRYVHVADFEVLRHIGFTFVHELDFGARQELDGRSVNFSSVSG